MGADCYINNLECALFHQWQVHCPPRNNKIEIEGELNSKAVSHMSTFALPIVQKKSYLISIYF